VVREFQPADGAARAIIRTLTTGDMQTKKEQPSSDHRLRGAAGRFRIGTQMRLDFSWQQQGRQEQQQPPTHQQDFVSYIPTMFSRSLMGLRSSRLAVSTAAARRGMATFDLSGSFEVRRTARRRVLCAFVACLLVCSTR
jgi:hypothetical protein